MTWLPSMVGLGALLVGFALGLIARPWLDRDVEAIEERGRRRYLSRQERERGPS